MAAYPLLQDVQADRLYEAEHELFLSGGKHRTFSSLDDIVGWINRRVVPSDWWQKNSSGINDVLVTAKCNPYLGKDFASADRHNGEATLFLPRAWSWNDIVVIHELCHAVVMHRVKQDHGPGFARQRLEAQYELGLANSGRMLEERFIENRVRYA